MVQRVQRHCAAHQGGQQRDVEGGVEVVAYAAVGGVARLLDNKDDVPGAAPVQLLIALACSVWAPAEGWGGARTLNNVSTTTSK